MRKIKTRKHLHRPPESWSAEARFLYRSYEASLWRELVEPKGHLKNLRPYFEFQVHQGFAFNEIDRPALDVYLSTLRGWRRVFFLGALARWLRFLKKVGQTLVPEEPELPGGPIHRKRRVDPYLELKPPAAWPERGLALYQQYRERLERRSTCPKAYLGPLHHFFRAQYKQGFTFLEFPRQLLDSYFAPLRPCALSQLLNALAGWLRFLYRAKQLLLPLHEKLAEYRQKRNHRRPILSHDQVIQVLGLASAQTTPEYLRDRALLEMAYASGMRAGELLALNLPELDLKRGLVQVVKTKNYRERRVPLTRIAVDCLKRYLAEARPELTSPLSLNALWLNQRGGRLTHNQLSRRFSRVYGCHEVLGMRFHLHLLRHACATHLLTSGAPLRHVQELLGHVDLASTETYTHLTPTHLAEQHRRCHPRFSPGFSRVSG